MPKKTKLNLNDLQIKSFQTMNEINKTFVGGYVTAHINTCEPCRPGGTNNPQCTIGC